MIQEVKEREEKKEEVVEEKEEEVVEVKEGLAEPMLVAVGVQELHLLDNNQLSCMFDKQRFVNYIIYYALFFVHRYHLFSSVVLSY